MNREALHLKNVALVVLGIAAVQIGIVGMVYTWRAFMVWNIIR